MKTILDETKFAGTVLLENEVRGPDYKPELRPPALSKVRALWSRRSKLLVITFSVETEGLGPDERRWMWPPERPHFVHDYSAPPVGGGGKWPTEAAALDAQMRAASWHAEVREWADKWSRWAVRP